MINNFVTQKNKIKTMLDALVTSNDLKAVYNYEKGDLGKYPAVTMYSAEYNPEWADTSKDRDVYVFTIYLYQEIKEKTPTEAETIVDNALVKIIQLFQVDYTLGGTCDMLNIRATKGWITREVPTRAATITITTKKLVSILS